MAREVPSKVSVGSVKAGHEMGNDISYGAGSGGGFCSEHPLLDRRRLYLTVFSATLFMLN
jgi:hypothetical protein